MTRILVCEICGARKKNMPHHIKWAHTIPNQELQEIAEELKEKPTEVDIGVPPRFDFGELNTCQQCRAVYPSKIMEFHMHIRHGM
mgnify:CR=1 FL=1